MLRDTAHGKVLSVSSASGNEFDLDLDLVKLRVMVMMMVRAPHSLVRVRASVHRIDMLITD